ncbi:hypothetical protein [Hugenholtzia roseola]|uniref:hypothetical protein n=1 Tax=Hugenholtzia roseola TaxID=1002 RepID=UPI00041BBA9C|nr:hypothetical protein [Hugenholtzia roseola]
MTFKFRNLLFQNLLLLAVLSLVFTSCKDDKEDEKPALQIPNSYDGAAFAANTAAEQALKGNLTKLTDEMKKGRTNGTSVDVSALNTLFTTGSPALNTSSTSYYAALISGSNGYLAELAKASGGTYTLGAPMGEGGTMGGYLFDENGIEMEQLVEKGLFGAALYFQATKTFEAATLTPADIDKIVALFGANPTFPNSNSSNVEQPDGVMAGYAARRDKNDGNGLYSQFKNNAIKLQAAVKAGNDYKTEQTEALNALKTTWEKANAATIINYCHATLSRLSATNPSENDIAAALHAYSEGVGFLHGWKTIPQAHRIITDAQIDEILALFNAPSGQVPTSYKFATDPVNELPKIQQAIDRLKAIYAFSNQDIEDFKKNWVSEQGR